jgi:hypothetical protein
MGWVAIGTAVLSAGASIYGARKSAEAYEEGADQAAAVQREAMHMQVALQRPHLEVGNSALATLSQIFGLAPPSQIDFDNLLSGSAGARQQQFQPGQGLTNQQQQVVQSFTASFGFNPLSSPEQASRVKTSHFASDRHFDDYGAFQAAFGYDPLKREGNPFLDKSLQRQRAAQAQATSGGLDLNRLVAQNPLIQFTQQQGERAIERGAAQRGLNQSGGTLTDLARFNQGLASQGIQQFVLNPLMELAGFGQRAAGNLGQAYTTTAGNLGNLYMGAADARGSAYQNTANQIAGLGGQMANLGMLKKFGYFDDPTSPIVTSSSNPGGYGTGPQTRRQE